MAHRIPSLILLLAALWWSAPARAQAPAAPPASGSSAADLDFDLGEAPAPKKSAAEEAAEKARAEQLGRASKARRAMLTTHQVLGFTMLGAMAATLVIGQLTYLDKYPEGAPLTYRYEKPHLGLSIATSVLFGGTGLLGLFAPNPYPKPIRLDSALVHKVAMILATAGMVTQVILGPVAVARNGYNNHGDLALGHLVAGYATWAFTATGVVAYLF